MPACSTAGPWPFLGRDEELAEVLRFLTGPDRVAGVHGAAGAGTTALLGAARDRLAARGWAAITIRGNGDVDGGAVATLAPLSGTSSDAFTAARAGLSSRCEAGPTMLVVDDAHLLDPVSAAFVEWTAEHSPASVLVGAETGMALPPAVARLRRGRPERWLELGPLPLDRVRELLTAVLGAPPDGLSLAELHEHTAGNPLYLRELVAAGQRSGAFVLRCGVWLLRWRDVPPSALDETAAVLASLDAAALAAAEVLACGEPLPVATLLRLADTSTLDLLERRGMLRISGTAAEQLARSAPALGQAIRAGLGEVRRRQVYAALARAVAPGGDGVELERQATWALRGGVPIDAESLVRAGWQAARHYRLDTAESLARSAVDAGGGWPARQLLAAALSQLRSGSADGAAQTALRHADSADRHTRSAVVAVESLYWNAGRRDEALGRSARLPGESADAAALRAILALFDGRPLDSLHIARPLLDGTDLEPGAAARLRRVAVFAAVAAGRAAEGLALAEHGLAAMGDCGREAPRRRRWLQWGLCHALIALGRVDEAAELADAGYRDGVRLRLPELAAGWLLAAAVVAQTRGCIAEAQGSLREAAALLDEHDPLRFTSVCLMHLAAVTAQLGDPDGAEAVLAQAGELRGANEAWQAVGVLAAGWIAHTRGERSEAAALAVRAAGLCAAGGDRNAEVTALHAVARFGEPHRATGRLHALAAEVDGPWPVLALRHAEALRERDARALEAVAAEYAGRGGWLVAAEASRAAAAAHGAAGRLGSALGARTRADEWLARCGGPPVSTLPAARSSPLTPREEEVLALAGGGRTSRSIAGRLGVSVRTVDNHLGSAYRKLGIAGRRGLG